jgi:hypothetical protein
LDVLGGQLRAGGRLRRRLERLEQRTRHRHRTGAVLPEGSTVDRAGNLYVGSMDMGVIYKATADGKTAAPFIDATAGGFVSVLGLYADDATKTLWACNSDAGNSQ